MFTVDRSLLENLQRLDSLTDHHQDLCRLAYNYRSLDLFDSLAQRQSAAASPSIWSGLRHYIGRLGSWPKAAKVLVRVATTLPHLIGGYRVECLVSPPPGLPPTPDMQTNLDSALRRMLPANSEDRLQQIRETLRDIRLFDVSASFRIAYTDDTFKPRVHAELLLLEHFFHHELDFVNNDRYIGCSKPSCYCCDMYMRFHPGSFVTRPCHGNLWVNWQAPAPLTKVKAKAQKHTASILNEMIGTIRKDVLFQIDSRSPRRPRAPDSTTGISTGLYGLQATMLEGLMSVSSCHMTPWSRWPLTLQANHRITAPNHLILDSHGIETHSGPSRIQETTPNVSARLLPISRTAISPLDVGRSQKRPATSDTSSTQGEVLPREILDAANNSDDDTIIFRGHNQASVA